MCIIIFQSCIFLNKINETNFDPAITQPKMGTKQRDPPRDNWGYRTLRQFSPFLLSQITLHPKKKDV